LKVSEVKVEGLAGTAVSRHKKILSTPLFRRVVPPVETDLGESSYSRLGIGWSTVSPEWKSSLWLFVKNPRSRIAYPDF